MRSKVMCRRRWPEEPNHARPSASRSDIVQSPGAGETTADSRRSTIALTTVLPLQVLA